MNTLRSLTLTLLTFLLLIPVSYSQESGTLVPPTLVPTVDAPLQDSVPTESRIARFVRDGRVRVGIYFNQPPFGELSIRGEISGFDADLARALAESWDVTLELVQVTQQNALDMLRQGHVDLLIARQIHRRELDTAVEFSQTYYVDQQSMMVRADDPAELLIHMVNRRIGYVLGTDGEQALEEWGMQTGIPPITQSYFTLDRAYVALSMGEIDGLIANRHRLIDVATQPDRVRMLAEPIVREPYAIVMLRQDVNLRNLANRTLQYLADHGTLEQLFQQHFPGEDFPADALAIWSGVGNDSPVPSQFSTDVPYPTEPRLPRILSERVIRVAGLADPPQNATESFWRVDTLNRALIEQLITRWGVTVQYLPNSGEDALALVEAGQADLAIGVEPDWNWSDRVDFAAPYLLHGDRLLVPANSGFQGFLDLRGRWVTVMDTDPGAAGRAVEVASSVNASIQIFTSREQDAALTVLQDANADVIYGDSFKLLAHLEAYPDAMVLTDRWYSRRYLGFAVPRNDLDFRLLVEYTVQEMVQDGTLAELTRSLLPEGDAPMFDIWPGVSEYDGLLQAR